MTVNNNYPYAPKDESNEKTYLKLLRRTINFVVNGKTNNTGEVTLRASQTTTTVNNPLCNANSVVLLQATTANAATDVGAAASVYVTAGDGAFTVTHPSDADIDKVFRYVIVG